MVCNYSSLSLIPASGTQFLMSCDEPTAVTRADRPPNILGNSASVLAQDSSSTVVAFWLALRILFRNFSDFTSTYLWWLHQMETFSALLALCAGNPLVTSEFPSQRPVTRSFDVFFDLRLNKQLRKQSKRRDLRRHRAHHDVTVMSATSHVYMLHCTSFIVLSLLLSFILCCSFTHRWNVTWGDM